MTTPNEKDALSPDSRSMIAWTVAALASTASVRRNRRRKLIALPILLCIGILTVADTVLAEFFVGLGGSDVAGNGSAGAPWRTMQFALTQIPDGTIAQPTVLNIGQGEFAETSDGTLGQLKITGRNFIAIQGAGAKLTGGTHISTTGFSKVDQSGIVRVENSVGIEFRNVVIGDDRNWSNPSAFFQSTVDVEGISDVTLRNVHVLGPSEQTLINGGNERAPTAVRAGGEGGTNSSESVLRLDHVLVTGHGSFMSNPIGHVFSDHVTAARTYGLGSDDDFMFLQTPQSFVDDPRFTFQDSIFYELKGLGGQRVSLSSGGGGEDNLYFGPPSQGGDGNLLVRGLFDTSGPTFYTDADLGHPDLFVGRVNGSSIMSAHGVFENDDTTLGLTGNLLTSNALQLADFDGFAFTAPSNVTSGWRSMSEPVVTWTVDADGNWQTASNWSSNPLLPNVADDVAIDVGGATTRTITIGTAVPAVHGLKSQENLTVSGGNLTIGAGGGFINGTLIVAPGYSLSVSQGTFSANGATMINGSSISAAAGGTLSLPALTSYAASFIYGQWNADGTNSTLSANSLTTFVTDTGGIHVSATNGGHVNLNNLVQGSGSSGYVQSYTSAGAGSVLSMPNVTNLQRVGLAIQSSGSMTTSQLQSVTQSSISVSNATADFSGLNNVDYSNLSVAAGSTLNVPGVTSYAASFIYGQWNADGTNSTLSANSLTTFVTDTGGILVSATNGGHVNLNNLVQGSGSSGYVQSYTSAGAGSVLSMPNVTNLERVGLSIQNSGSMTTSQLQSVTQSSISVSNATPDFSGLTNVNYSNLNVQSGGTLNLPGVTSYATSSIYGVWTADGISSALSANSLIAINTTTGNLTINATTGGHVDLNGLTQVSGANGNYVQFLPSGADSQINAPLLTTIAGGNIIPRNNGVVKLTSGTATVTQTTVSTATGGKVEVGTLVLQTGSLLFGDGNGIGSVVNTAGRVAPGLSPGILSLSGTFSQASAGTLAIDVGGPVIGVDTDRLAVGGAASVGGKLEVTLPNMFTTTLGTTYDILTASSVTGSFSSSTGRLVNPQIFLGIVYLSDRVRLKAANAGDVNLDGIVNIFDINSVSSTWNTGSPSGDANADGIVNIFDINLISSNWGAHQGSATPVPEPSTLVLLLLSTMAVAVHLLAKRRRRFAPCS